MSQTARKSFVATAVAVAVVATALALWHLKVLIALLLVAMIISSAMRPGIELLHRHRIPRGFGVAIHYAGVVVVLGLLLWLIVPRVITQVQHASGSLPGQTGELHQAVKNSTGIKHDILAGIESRLNAFPHGSKLVHQAINAGKMAIEVLVGIFFTLAIAAYWIFEKERAQSIILRLVRPERRKVVADTWDLIDAKLGAFVRGQLLLITMVSTILSVAFWIDGLPYFLLLGIFAGLVEIVPVVGPLIAGIAAIGVGFTVDVGTAAGAAIAVFGLRLLQDYVINPRVLGHAVGLSPLIVLVTVPAVGLLFGGFYVLLSVPIAAVLATLVRVIVLDKDPAEEEPPTVLFPAKEVETG